MSQTDGSVPGNWFSHTISLPVQVAAAAATGGNATVTPATRRSPVKTAASARRWLAQWPPTRRPRIRSLPRIRSWLRPVLDAIIRPPAVWSGIEVLASVRHLMADHAESWHTPARSRSLRRATAMRTAARGILLYVLDAYDYRPFG